MTMSTGLDAVYDELRRLQQEGVDHVYIGDETAAQLTSTKPAIKPPAAEPAQEAAKTPEAEVDLRELVETKSTAPTPVSEQTKKPDLKPIPEKAPEIQLPQGDDAAAQMKWLQELVENCTVCNEHLGEDGKVVFGGGNVQADIFFCGEAPGADEALTGQPFCGKSGQLLTKIIQAMGLDRESVYTTYILKWRPEHDKPYGNRPPTEDEMNFCLPYLKAQIEIVQPKVIIALGNTSVSGLLGADPKRRMGSVRGTWENFESTPMMITFHPSYLLRNDTLKTKRMVWEDMLQVMEKIELPISEKQRGFFLPKS